MLGTEAVSWSSKSNYLLHCQLQKLNLFLQQLVLVRLSGRGEFLKSYGSSKLETLQFFL
jgi:hypothetical protein